MDDTEYEKLLGSAIRFVSFRPRSEKEIRDFCAKTLKRHHTTAPVVVEKVIARMSEYGYVDDAKFMSWWVDQRTAFRPKGLRVIISELRAKGIPREMVESYFSSSRPTGERELAKKAVSKKITVWERLPLIKRKQKIAEFLLRRGFDSETVYSVVDELLGKE